MAQNNEVIIHQDTIVDEETMEKVQNEMTNSKEDYPNIDYAIIKKKEEENYLHTNKLTKDYQFLFYF